MYRSEEPRQIYEVACRLVEAGLSVIPTGGGAHSLLAKQPHHGALKGSGHKFQGSDGKEHATWLAFQDRQPTRAELLCWYRDHHARGVGMVTGAISGLIAIDVDVEGLPLLAQLGWKPHVISPSGGAHLYVRHPGWRVNSNASKNTKALPPGFDVRGDGGYIMLPPSRTAKGQYRRTEHRALLRISEIPEEVCWEGQSYRLREALGLIRPQPKPEGRPDYQPFYGEEDERCPMWLILERAVEHAPDSRNKGAFFLGLWASANGYQVDETLRYVDDYLFMVHGLKDTPFTRYEAETASRSGHSRPRLKPWIRREE